MPFGRQLLLSFNLENTFVFSLAAMLSSWHLALCDKDLAFQLSVKFRLPSNGWLRATLDCCSNGDSRWPVGHFVVFQEGSQYQIHHLGAVKPKIILLVLEDQYGHPSIWMIGATAYNVSLQGGQSVPRIFDAAIVRPSQDSDTHAWLEHCDGQT